jgi:acyl-CoA thioester hydrolase
MAGERPLLIYSTAIAPEWIDYNGHLRDAYYGLVLSYAADALMDQLGIDETYRKSTSATLYTLEQHLHFLHEVMQSDHLEVRVRLLAADTKRMHAAFDFYCARYADPVAIGEVILLHVKQGAVPAAAPFPEAIAGAVAALVAASAGLPAPGPPSRRLELRPR